MTGTIVASGDVTSLTNGVGKDATLTNSCYYAMFQGCTSLTTAPELPATTMVTDCYNSMFSGCTSLKAAPALPATTLASSCYSYMFNGCTSLKVSTTQTGNYTKSWTIPSTGTISTTLTDWNTAMFTGTGGSFTDNPALNTTYYLYEEPTIPLTFTAETAGSTVTLKYKSGSDVKYKLGNDDWTAYTKGTEITLANVNDTVSFKGIGVVTDSGNHFSMTGKIAASGDVTGLTNGAGGNATLTNSCYYAMFQGCTSLTTAPELPATRLNAHCYISMFYNCTSLKAAPALPATTMVNNCYNGMFSGCTGLETAPALPAITLATNCYNGMFSGCTGLKAAPALPATTLAEYCYYEMFKGCTSLTSPSELPATTLATSCYSYMFNGCTSLKTAPELPATTLATSCYSYMFKGCISLTAPSELPATTLAEYCYYDMFNGCTSLRVSTTQTGNYTKEWRIPTTGTITTTATGWSGDMLYRTNGLFKDDPTENTTYYIYVEPTPLTFTAETAGSTVTLKYKSGSDVKYKLGNNDWTAYTKGTEITLTNAGDTVSFKGTGVVTDTNNYFTMTGKIAASGDVTSLTNGDGGDATLTDFCYYSMFQGCTSLTTAPELPATKLATSCYYAMFQGCTSLEAAPELPAKTLDMYCYTSMFYNCTSLKTAPELPATKLASSCYSYMFNGCTSLRISTTQTGNYTKEWRIPTTGTISTTASGWNTAMFTGTGGTFTDNPALNTSYYLYEEPAIPLTFTAETAGSTVTLNYKSGSDVMYKLGNNDWTTYTKGTAITLTNANDTVSFKGTGVTTDADNHFSMTGKIAASGDVTSLTNGVGGDATLTNSCYNSMFNGCTSLKTAPELPATTLAVNCYQNMFSGCTGLRVNNTQTGDYTKEWRIPTTGTIKTTATGWNTGMLYGTNGLFKDDPTENTTYYIYVEPTPLTFTAETAGSTVTLKYKSGSDVMYKLGNDDWTAYTKGTVITLTNAGDTVSFKGTGIVTDGNNYFSMTGKIAASGDVTSLTNGVGGDVTLTDSCYYNMFYGCTSLTEAPELPATTMADSCYHGMFSGCTSLTVAPALPATTLAMYCYRNMFYGCTNLTGAPGLPATTLASSCYASMFFNCISLKIAPELPATTLASSCYYGMFESCTSLIAPPELPATTLVGYCYYNMFYCCASIRVSDTQTGKYTKAWRIPSTGTITTTASGWNIRMLYETKGTFTDYPAENTTYYIYEDIILPVISGIENGKTYCQTAAFTVAGDSLDKVTVNGSTLTAVNGTYTLTAVGTNTVVATDKSGNSTTVTVTINADHIDTDNDNVCNICGNYIAAPINNGVYEIGNAGQLMWLAVYVNSGKTNVNAALVNDIDMTNLTWPGITSYSGTFDGKGYTINNLNDVKAVQQQNGFITTLEAGSFVQNLSFNNAELFCDAANGLNAVIAGKNNGTIQNCMVTNSLIQSDNSRNLSAAIAAQNNGTIRNCYAYNIIFSGATSVNGAIVATGTAPVNSYYKLSTASMAVDSTVDGISKTSADFADGTVAYLLNNGKTDGTQIWYQNIDNGFTPYDDLPKFTGGTVYSESGKYTNCKYIKSISDSTSFDEVKKYIYTDITALNNVNTIIAPCIGYNIAVTPSLLGTNYSYCGTGSIINVSSAQGLAATYTLVVMGDINGDSVCDVIDCMLAELAASNNLSFSGANLVAADSNEDAGIDVQDYQQIINRALSE